MNTRQSALFLYEEAMGYTYAAALRAAAVIGVADHLADGPRTAPELGAVTGTDASGLYRILRMLAVRGIVSEDPAGRFRLTEKGDALRSDAPVSARSGILMFTDRMFWTMTHEAAKAVRDRQPSFDEIFGMPLADYFDRDPETEALYYEGMETVSDAENAPIAQSYEFPVAGTVADIGGGRGGFLLAVLRENPKLHGVLLDRHGVVSRHRLDSDDVAGRWSVVGGDFLSEVPPADVYLLKRILHNWDDERSVRILRNCRDAMATDGRVLVVDAVVPPGSGPHQSKPMDFMMLAALTGQERTEAELMPLFEAAGLRVTRVVPTGTVMSIVEAAAG